MIQPRQVQDLIDICFDALKNNNKIFIIGNGGSAANASHFGEDLGKGVNKALETNPLYSGVNGPKKRLKVISLTDSVPYITAIGNDYSFDKIFLTQLESLAEPNDVLIASSVSGMSQNLVKTLHWANNNSILTVAITGKKALESSYSINTLANYSITIESQEYGIVEDATMTIFHIVANFIMDKLS